jgi:hypothetical protein
MKHQARMTKEARSTKHETTPWAWHPFDVASAAPFAVLLLLFIFQTSALPSARAEETAAKSPLTGKVELRFQRCRSGAPIPIVWEIEWNEQAIAQGDLDYEIEDGNQVLTRFRLPDLVLSPGKNVFNAMLPAMSVYGSSAPVVVRARFVSGKRSFEFEEQSLRVPSRFTQWFNVGVVSSAIAKPSREESRLFEAIRWERFLPANDNRDRSTTVSLDFQTAALPADPLTLCNFDVVVVLPAALVEIRDDQADALKKWVTAGGSLCVVAGGGLTPRHAALINPLLAESVGHEAFGVDAQGYLAPGEKFAGEIISARKGLGRVVMLRQALLQKLTPDAKEWLDATGFLMKVRREQVKLVQRPPAGNSPAGNSTSFPPPGWTVGSTGAAPRTTYAGGNRRPKPNAPASMPPVQSPRVKVQKPLPTGMSVPRGIPNFSGGQWSVVSSRRMYDPGYLMGSELSAPPLASLEGLIQILMPRDVQVVPLGLIAAILAAYVLTIGPVDYCLLGFFRQRRLTWILFPVVTIAFAGFTLWLSRSYLGTNDSRRAIDVYDVVRGGVAARHTRIELLFLSEQRELGTDVQNGAFSRIGLGTVSDPRLPRLPGSSDAGRVEQSAYVGRFPSRYTVGQAIPQWTPVANRFFWIDPQPVTIASSPGANPKAPFDWDDPGDLTTDAGRTALAARIRGAFGDAACAVVYRGHRAPLPIRNSIDSLHTWQPTLEPYMPRFGTDTIVYELSARTPEKLFSLASQISPNGGPGLEDLAILDGSDARQSLLVIAVETGSKMTLYRRLYVGGP